VLLCGPFAIRSDYILSPRLPARCRLMPGGTRLPHWNWIYSTNEEAAAGPTQVSLTNIYWIRTQVSEKQRHY